MKTFNTRKSLYAPVEIQVDDKVYQTIKLTSSALLIFAGIEKRVAAVETTTEATYEWVCAMFGIEKAVLEKLDWREVEDIYLDTTRTFRETELERRDKELKGLESHIEQIKKVKDVTKEIPNSKNLKRSGDKK